MNSGAEAGIASGAPSMPSPVNTVASANMPGIFYFGPNQIEDPFGDGYRCVGGHVRRLPVSFASGGNLSHDVDYNANYAAGVITAGSSWNFQAWFRDPAANGATFNLSDGLHVTFCP